MENPEKICDVCREGIEIYAIGECDHPICLTCSTRMRILIGQDYCPICRANLPKVIFSDDLKPFRQIEGKFLIPFKKHGIFFRSRKVEEACLELLQHRCPICPDRAPDTSFRALETHLRRDHSKFFCDLCLEHLKLFTHERKIYSRKDLATHRRIGDADEKSYKGHPLCKFCDVRYMDNDELFRHLRKDHFFCHFCGDDEFYSDYDHLKNHFKTDHHLCQEGECGSPNTRFTHAFRSEIDLKAHLAAEHSQTLSKSQAKEARHLDLEFNYANAPRRRERGPRPGREEGADGGRERGPRNRGDRYDRKDAREQEDLSRAMELSRREAQRGRNSPSSFEGGQRGGRGRNSPSVYEENGNSSPSPPLPPPPDPVDSEHYPTLNGKEPAAPIQRPPQPVEEEYPSLSRGPSAASAPGRAQAAPASLASRLNRPTAASEAAAHRPAPVSSSSFSHMSSRVEPTVAARKPETTTSAAAAAAGTMRAPKEEDFPSLGGGSRSGVAAPISGVWVKGKGGAKPTVVQAPPRTDRVELGRGRGVQVPPKSAANFGRNLKDDSEFPSLGGGRSAAIVPPGTWVKKSNGSNQNRSRKDGHKEPKPDWFDVRDSFANDFNDCVVKQPSDDFIKPSGKTKKKKNTDQEFTTTSTFAPKKEASSSGKAFSNSFSVLASAEEVSAPPALHHATNGWSDASDDLGCSSDSGPDVQEKFVREPEKKVEPRPAPPSFDLGADFPDLGGGSRKDAYLGQSQVNRKKNKSKASAAKPVEKPEPKVDVPTGPSKSLDGIASLLLGPKPLPASAKQVPSKSATRNAQPPPSHSEDEEDKAPEALGAEISENGLDGAPSLRLPPGFQSLPSPRAAVAPPPGFSSLPEESSFSYMQPLDFSQRNSALVQTVKEVLKNDEFKFAQFKRLSMQFRQNELRAADYYSNCRELIGPANFPAVFSELIALLPDISKQRELLKAHQASVSRAQSKMLPISKKKAEWDIQEMLSSCPLCQQVLLPADVAYHRDQHNPSDFPAFQEAVSRIGTS